MDLRPDHRAPDFEHPALEFVLPDSHLSGYILKCWPTEEIFPELPAGPTCYDRTRRSPEQRLLQDEPR